MFDSKASGTTSGTILTYSHTCSGTDRYLAVSLATHVSVGVVNGVTYAGAAMTLIGGHNGANNTRIQLWGLVNPATGANNIVVSKQGSSAIRAMSYSFNGVNQTSPINASLVYPRTDWISKTTFNPSLTASATGTIGVLAFFADSGPALTAGTNSTLEVQEITAFGQSIARNTSPVSGTTVQITMTSASQGFAGVMAALNPSVTTKTLVKRTYTGVGYIHMFKNTTTGVITNVPCTQQEYASLGQTGGNQFIPTLAGNVWIGAGGGTISVNTTDTTLAENDYCDLGSGNVAVYYKNSGGFPRYSEFASTTVSAEHKIDTNLLN